MGRKDPSARLTQATSPAAAEGPSSLFCPAGPLGVVRPLLQSRKGPVRAKSRGGGDSGRDASRSAEASRAGSPRFTSFEETKLQIIKRLGSSGVRTPAQASTG